MDPLKVPLLQATLRTVPLVQVDLEDNVFQLRPIGDVAPLAQSLAEHGQALPLVVRRKGGDAWQILDGFRRLAALQSLGVGEAAVWAFEELPDETAVLLSVSLNAHRSDVTSRDLSKYVGHLTRRGMLNERARAFLLERIAADALTPPRPPPSLPASPAQEVYLDDLVAELLPLFRRVSWSLDQVREHWGEVLVQDRDRLLALCRYIRDLTAYLERQKVREGKGTP